MYRILTLGLVLSMILLCGCSGSSFGTTPSESGEEASGKHAYSDEGLPAPNADMVFSGEYFIGPAACANARRPDVVIKDGKFTDHSGTITPSHFSFDKIEVWQGARDGGTAPGVPQLIHIAYTREASGGVSLAIFAEVPWQDLAIVKSRMGIMDNVTLSSDEPPNPLLFSRIKFHREPTMEEVSERVQSDDNDEYVVLEKCS